jgi:hypothetical protein
MTYSAVELHIYNMTKCFNCSKFSGPTLLIPSILRTTIRSGLSCAVCDSAHPHDW